MSRRPFRSTALTSVRPAARVKPVFTPIAPLRAILAGFFQVLMRNGNAVLHIGVCLALSAALSFAGLAVLRRKTL